MKHLIKKDDQLIVNFENYPAITKQIKADDLKMFNLLFVKIDFEGQTKVCNSYKKAFNLVNWYFENANKNIGLASEKVKNLPKVALLIVYQFAMQHFRDCNIAYYLKQDIESTLLTYNWDK